MKLKLSDLYRWDGIVNRGPFLLIGTIGFAIKYNLDRFVAAQYFDRTWSLFNYFIPDETHTNALTKLDQSEAELFATFFVIALPFIWTGLALTIRRLRAIQLPLWLVLLFFVPFVNLVFFLIIGLIPSKVNTDFHLQKPEHKELAEVFDDGEPSKGINRPTNPAKSRYVPKNPLGAAALGVLVTVLPAILMVVFSVNLLEQYGLGLFIGIPFFVGFSSVLFYGYHEPRSYIQCAIVSLISVSVFGFLLLMAAIEGAFCILMAAPIGGMLSLIGGTLAWGLQRRAGPSFETRNVYMAMLIATPLLMGAEHVSSPKAPLIEVKTIVEIDASREEVWNNVVTFSELPKPEHFLFTSLGISYPLRAEIKGTGVGAVRHCVFSTGPFVEPIEVWNEPKHLKFTVTSQPPPMKESSPWGEIDAPHLDRFLVSEGGQFVLVKIGPNKTRLEGTTWYRHNIWPAAYWRVWSDMIIHSIHSRVLNHIKTLSEKKKSKAPK